MLDIEMLSSAIAGMIKDITGPLHARIEALEAKLASTQTALGEVKGIGLAGGMIDRDGNLVLTLSDGSTKALGPVVGRDGVGSPGRDGIGFEDLSLEYDDHGRAVAKFTLGDQVKEIVLPGLVDRGPYRQGEAYRKGDVVSYGGSMWIAQEATEIAPKGGNEWRLAVKKGRDGKDAEREPIAPKAVRVG